MPEASPQPRSIANTDISDEDVLDAMQQIPGYLDITTGDFRMLYGLAREHALERMFARVRTDGLMRTDVKPVRDGAEIVRVGRGRATRRPPAPATPSTPPNRA